MLLAPATPNASPCNEFGEVNGICVAGEFTLGSDEVGAPIHGRARERPLRPWLLSVRGGRRTTRSTRPSPHVDTGRNHRFGLVAFTVQGIRLLDEPLARQRRGWLLRRRRAPGECRHRGQRGVPQRRGRRHRALPARRVARRGARQPPRLELRRAGDGRHRRGGDGRRVARLGEHRPAEYRRVRAHGRHSRAALRAPGSRFSAPHGRLSRTTS